MRYLYDNSLAVALEEPLSFGVNLALHELDLVVREVPETVLGLQIILYGPWLRLHAQPQDAILYLV